MAGFSVEHSGQPLCGIYALHVLTGRSVPFLMRMYKKKFNKSDKWRGSTTTWGVLQILCKYKKIKGLKMKRQTLRKFVEMETASKDKFLVHISGHFVSVVNQKVIDQGGVLKPVDEHWCKNRFVKEVWKVGG